MSEAEMHQGLNERDWEKAISFWRMTGFRGSKGSISVKNKNIYRSHYETIFYFYKMKL